LNKRSETSSKHFKKTVKLKRFIYKKKFHERFIIQFLS